MNVIHRKTDSVNSIRKWNDAYSSVDSLNGKATRKTRAWLLGAISRTEILEADLEYITYTNDI